MQFSWIGSSVLLNFKEEGTIYGELEAEFKVRRCVLDLLYKLFKIFCKTLNVLNFCLVPIHLETQKGKNGLAMLVVKGHNLPVCVSSSLESHVG